MEDILKYKNYSGVVHYSAEDEIFFGKIIGINDLVTFEGSTVKELQRSFKEAVDDYLQTCAELGKEPEKKYKGSFNVRIPTSLHQRVAFLSTQRKISLNDYVKAAINYAVKHDNVISQEFHA